MTKIARIEPIPIEYPDPNDFGTIRRTVLVRVETSDGVVGWGESIAMWPEACRATALVIRDGLTPILLGEAIDIETLWVKMRRHVWWYGEGGIASLAISGIDMALWDIQGKLAGKPLYELFGGLKHDRLLANASSHVNKKGEAACVADVEGFFAAGFRSTKLGFAKKGESNIGGDPDTDVSFIRALRSALGPDAGKTSASRQTFVSGRAAMAAGLALRAELVRLANGDGALAFEQGAVTVGGRRIDLGALPLDGFGYAVSAQESYDPPTQALDANGQGAPYAVYGYGGQMVELQVDARLGTVRLIKITAAHDVGRAINPQLVEGQIEGGIAQGIGMALMEEYLPGRTENLHDYLIPTIGDVPAIESLIIEVPDADGPYGAKGLGEHVLIPTAPAILNAIRHATGAEIDRLPALPHRVLAAIKAVKP